MIRESRDDKAPACVSPEAGVAGRPLRVLLINQCFWPDVVATAQQAHDLAAYLTAHGDLVTVVSSRSLYGQKGAALPAHERVGGIEIHRVSRNLFRKRGLFTRAIDYVRFSVACLVKCLMLPRQDVVICLTTPPFIAIIGLALRLLKGSRFVLWSMDLYPDLPVQAGIIRRGGFFHRVLRFIDVTCLRHADRIVALGSCMRERILAKGIKESRIELIHPWSDPIEIGSRESTDATDEIRNPFRSEWGIGDRFVIEYSGNYGLGHDVDTVARAMLAMRDDDGIRWVIVGDGIMKPSIVSFVAEHRIRNVVFQPYQPRRLLGPLIQMGDVHLVLMMPGYEGIILPSKFYGILASGRPAILVGPQGSEVARVIDREQCGVVIRNGDHAGLVEAINRLRQNPELRATLGRRGRAALEGRYSMQHACERWRRVLRDSVNEMHARTDVHRQVARLHIEGLSSGFLSTLGEDFLARLYRTIDEDPSSCLRVEWSGDRIVGFVAGTSGVNSVLSSLRKHPFAVAWALRGTLLKPSRMAGIFRICRYMLRRRVREDGKYPKAELLSIVVSPECRGRGVADRLYHGLVEDMRTWKVDSFKIIVGGKLLPARRFYERHGAVAVGGAGIHDGAGSLVYVSQVGTGTRDGRST